MPSIVGVDAGATATTVIADDGTTSQTLVGGAANLRTAGVAAAAETIAGTVLDASGPSPIAAVVVGAAGAGDSHRAEALAGALRARIPGARIAVHDDARIALRAAVPVGDGAVLISGTGSIAYAEIDGVRYRAGGYGHLLGDEGSGYALGNAAVRLLLRSYDGRTPRDAFLDTIAHALVADSANDVIARVYDSPNPVATLAALAPVVLEHASAGDRTASKLVQNAALELFDLVKAVMRNAGVSDRAMPLVFAGGLLRANSLLSYLLETRLSHDFPHLETRKGAPPPHLGALALARALVAHE